MIIIIASDGGSKDGDKHIKIEGDINGQRWWTMHNPSVTVDPVAIAGSNSRFHGWQ